MSTLDAFETPHAAPDPNGIAALRDAHGPLPDSYIAFLETIDGGRPSPQMLVFGYSGRPHTIGVRRIHSAAEALEATTNLRDLGEIPPGTIEIGKDLSGHNNLLMITDGPRAGAIHVRTNETNETVAASLTTYLPHAPHIADTIQDLVDNHLLAEDETAAAAAALETAGIAPAPPSTQSNEATNASSLSRPDLDAAVYFLDTITDLNYTPLKAVRANDGIAAAPSWEPVELALNQPDVSADWDLLTASGFAVLRPAAREALQSFFERYGELLEISTDDGPMWVFRCLNRIDALVDPTTAVGDDGWFTSPYDLVFDEAKCADAGIFTIADQTGDRWHTIFYTQPAVATITTAVRARGFIPLTSR